MEITGTSDLHFLEDLLARKLEHMEDDVLSLFKLDYIEGEGIDAYFGRCMRDAHETMEALRDARVMLSRCRHEIGKAYNANPHRDEQ